jgi:hypothetical protein
MNIALVLQHKLLLGIHRLLSGQASSAEKSLNWASAPQLPVQAPCKASSRNSEAHATPSSGPFAKKVMPLRVLRVLEKGQPRSCAGRLVISGRMDDVCAELDRLVAHEATLH